MVDIISDVLSEYTADPYYKADALLQLLEEQGMLPPTIKNPEIPKEWDKMTFYTQKAIAKYHNEFISYPEFSVNEWEKEDEKE